MNHKTRLFGIFGMTRWLDCNFEYCLQWSRSHTHWTMILICFLWNGSARCSAKMNWKFNGRNGLAFECCWSFQFLKYIIFSEIHQIEAIIKVVVPFSESNLFTWYWCTFEIESIHSKKSVSLGNAIS